MLRYPYTIERGERFPDEPIAHRRLRQTVDRDPGAGRRSTNGGRELRVELGSAIVQGEAPKSGVFVPLLVGGEATGRISLQNLDREHAFSEADVRLLVTLAGSLSVALENARLFEETRQRNAELALINDVQRGLAENLDMQAMYDLVGERMAEIFDAQTVDIGVVDESDGQIRFPYSIERGSRLIRRPIDAWGSGRSRSRRASPWSSTRTWSGDARRRATRVAIAGEPSMSAVFVPLIVGNRGTGVMSLHNLDREHAFSESDVRLLTTLAGSLASRSRTPGCSRRRVSAPRELAIVNSVGQALAEQLELDALIERLGDQLQSLFERGHRLRRPAQPRERPDRVRLLLRGRTAGRLDAAAVRAGADLEDPPVARATPAEPDAGVRGRR